MPPYPNGPKRDFPYLLCFAALCLISGVTILVLWTRSESGIAYLDKRPSADSQTIAASREESQPLVPASLTASGSTASATAQSRASAPSASPASRRNPAHPLFDPVNDDSSYPFFILESYKDLGTGQVRFRRRGVKGGEVQCYNPEARRRVPSENQAHYPEPESACGPTAILNWVLWYQDQKVLRSPVSGGEDNSMLKRYDFKLIEEALMQVRGSNSAYRGGTTALEQIAAFDRVVARLSDGKIRMHHERFEAPLNINDLLEFTRGYRCAILVCRPVHPTTGALEGWHAVSAVAGDRAGYAMINNWGKKLYGPIRNEPDGQFFTPQEPGERKLKIEYLVCLTPFKPWDTKAIAIQDKRPTTLPQQRYTPSPRPSPRVIPANTPTSNQQRGPLEISPWSTIPSSPGTHGIRVYNGSDRDIALYTSTLECVFADGTRAYPDDIERFVRHDPKRSQSQTYWDSHDRHVRARQSEHFRLTFRDSNLRNQRIVQYIQRL